MRVVVNLHNSAGVVISRHQIPDHLVYSVKLPSDYLVSAGQDFHFGISASVAWDVDPAPGEDGTKLVNGTHVSGVQLVKLHKFYDHRQVPSKDPLSIILKRAVQHGVDYPTHGTGCICMDEFSREIKRQIDAATDPDPVTEAEYQAETHDEWNARMRAKERIRYLLESARRSL